VVEFWVQKIKVCGENRVSFTLFKPVGGADAEPRDLTRLYRRYWAELCGHIARNFGAGPPEPEDVVQTAFLRLASLTDPQSVGNPRAFLYRIARNVVIDHHRKEIVRSRFQSRAINNSADQSAENLAPEQVLSSKQRLMTIEAAIRALEPKQRMVFIMNRIHELSFVEISRRTGMAETTVKRYVCQAVIECERAVRAVEGFRSEDTDV
jgi:RNA polymerase sigma factor (sigma-70 family)